MLPCYALYKNGYPLLLDTTAWNLDGSMFPNVPIQTGIDLEMNKLKGRDGTKSLWNASGIKWLIMGLYVFSLQCCFAEFEKLVMPICSQGTQTHLCVCFAIPLSVVYT